MKAAQGFTLLEVIITLAIFSTALLALGRMQIAASQASTAAGRLSRATALAQDTAERLMAFRYNHPLLDDQTPAGQTTTYREATPPTGYAVTWTVDTDRPVVGVKTVNLTVSWDNRGQPKTFTLAFYKGS